MNKYINKCKFCKSIDVGQGHLIRDDMCLLCYSDTLRGKLKELVLMAVSSSETIIDQGRQIRELEARPRLEGFNDFIKICDGFLEKYPSEIFDGSSGDTGPLFIVDLRKAICELKERESEVKEELGK